MGYIHCCGALHKTRSYKLVPIKDFVICELDVLEVCPSCGAFVVQVTRVSEKDELSVIRKTNNKAKKFLANLQSKILYEIKNIDYSKYSHSSFYLNYNEFGVQKRCYSNLSTMKMGRF